MAAVASRHHYETLDGSAFHRFHHLVRQGENLVVGKASHDSSLLDLLRRRTGFRFFDDGGKILGFAVYPRGNVRRIGIARHACGKELVSVGVVLFQRHQAVGGHENGTVERFELLVLFPPGVAVISHEVIVFFKGGIIVCRKHFAVGIYVHPGAFGLFEKILHIPKVMAADENARIVPNADIHLGDFRIAVGRGVGLVQKRHGLYGFLSCLEHQSRHGIHRKILGGGGEGGHEEIVDLGIFIIQYRRMFRIGGDSLEPYDEQFPKGAHVLVFRGKNAHGLRLFPESFQPFGVPGGGIMHLFRKRLAVLFLILLEKRLFQGVPASQPFLYPGYEDLVVPVGVGDGGEKPLRHEEPFRRKGDPLFLSLFMPESDALERVDEKVLKICGLFGFATDPPNGTRLVLRGFLTLETIHMHPPFLAFPLRYPTCNAFPRTFLPPLSSREASWPFRGGGFSPQEPGKARRSRYTNSEEYLWGFR